MGRGRSICPALQTVSTVQDSVEISVWLTSSLVSGDLCDSMCSRIDRFPPIATLRHSDILAGQLMIIFKQSGTQAAGNAFGSPNLQSSTRNASTRLQKVHVSGAALMRRTLLRSQRSLSNDSHDKDSPCIEPVLFPL